MIVLAIIVTALLAAVAWGEHLAHRYGEQVSPDGTIPQGFALLTGWFLIALTATVLLIVVVL